MPGLIVTLSGNSAQFNAMMTQSVATAKRASATMAAEQSALAKLTLASIEKQIALNMELGRSILPQIAAIAALKTEMVNVDMATRHAIESVEALAVASNLRRLGVGSKEGNAIVVADYKGEQFASVGVMESAERERIRLAQEETTAELALQDDIKNKAISTSQAIQNYKIRQAAAFAAVGQTAFAPTLERTAAQWAEYNAGIKVAEESAKALKTEMWAANAAVIASAGGGGGLFGGHGGGLTGIIRESLVIMREVSMGRGMGRIGGSITLLAQYMGLLNKAVKSTATTAVLAAAAEKKLSLEMAVAAARAKGTAAETELLAAAQKQAAISAEAQTVADQELAVAQVELNAVFFIGIGLVVAIGAAAFLAWRHFKNAAIEAKNLANAMNPLKTKYTELAKARADASDAAQKNADWLRQLADNHKSESDQIERKIKLLKEEAKARGLTDQQTLQSEKTLLETEQARLKVELDKANAAEKAASDAANDPAKATALRGAQRVANDAGKIMDAAEDAASATHSQTVQNILSDQKKKYGGAATWRGEGMGLLDIAMTANAGVKTTDTIDMAISRLKAINDTTKRDIDVPGLGKMSISLETATANFESASAAASKLATDQKALEDVMANAKSTSEEKQAAKNKVDDDLQDVIDQLGNKAYGKSSSGRMDVTERERIGLGAASSVQVSMLDFTRKIEQHGRESKAILDYIKTHLQGNDGGFE